MYNLINVLSFAADFELPVALKGTVTVRCRDGSTYQRHISDIVQDLKTVRDPSVKIFSVERQRVKWNVGGSCNFMLIST